MKENKSLLEMINNIDINEIKIDDLSDKELLESHGLVCESDNLFDIIYGWCYNLTV